MDQLALFAGLRFTAVGADHHHLGEGNCGPDTVGMLVDQRGIQAGRAKRFGKPVHQVQPRPRKQRAQLWRWVLSPFAAVALIVLGFVLGQRNPPAAVPAPWIALTSPGMPED